MWGACMDKTINNRVGEFKRRVGELEAVQCLCSFYIESLCGIRAKQADAVLFGVRKDVAAHV